MAYKPQVLETAAGGTGLSAAGTSGNVLTSNGTIWTSAPPSGGGGGLTFNNVTGTTQAMAVNNGYIANNASLVTFTLPSTATIGQIVQVVGAGAGGWTIAQNSGQVMHFGNINSTSGVGGSLSSSNQYDGIQLICTATNTDWTCTGVFQGNPNAI